MVKFVKYKAITRNSIAKKVCSGLEELIAQGFEIISVSHYACAVFGRDKAAVIYYKTK